MENKCCHPPTLCGILLASKHLYAWCYKIVLLFPSHFKGTTRTDALCAAQKSTSEAINPRMYHHCKEWGKGKPFHLQKYKWLKRETNLQCLVAGKFIECNLGNKNQLYKMYTSRQDPVIAVT